MQLVLSGNRIVAHGENFLSMGGVVINTETGAKYEGATIAECENCPSDIGQVGYEYHAGAFVPCAPFGKGTGTVAVYCDDCKTPRDSGIHIEDVARKIILLWENATPVSNFDAQTVTLLNSDWDFLLIQPVNGATTIVTKTVAAPSGFLTSYVGSSQLIESFYDTNYFQSAVRDVSAEGNTVEFSAAAAFVMYSTDSIDNKGTSNGRCVPYKIYGVKI